MWCQDRNVLQSHIYIRLVLLASLTDWSTSSLLSEQEHPVCRFKLNFAIVLLTDGKYVQTAARDICFKHFQNHKTRCTLIWSCPTVSGSSNLGQNLKVIHGQLSVCVSVCCYLISRTMVAGKDPVLNIDFSLATVVMALEPVQQWGGLVGKQPC